MNRYLCESNGLELHLPKDPIRDDLHSVRSSKQEETPRRAAIVIGIGRGARLPCNAHACHSRRVRAQPAHTVDQFEQTVGTDRSASKSPTRASAHAPLYTLNTTISVCTGGRCQYAMVAYAG